MGNDFDEWASIIRSTLMTSKTPLTPHEINRDVKMLEGCDIPFRKLECQSLEDMLRKVPHLKIMQSQGRILVQAMPTEDTAHIARLVSLQKNSKKKSKRTIPHFTRKYDMHKRPNYNNNNNNNYNFNNSNSARNVSHRPKSNVDSRFYSANRSNSFDQTKRTPPQPSPSHSMSTRSMSVPHASQQNNGQQSKAKPFQTTSPKHTQSSPPRQATSPTSKTSFKQTSPTPKSTVQQQPQKQFNIVPTPSLSPLPVPHIPSLLKTIPAVIASASSFPQKTVQFAPTPISQRLLPPQPLKPLMSMPIQVPVQSIQQPQLPIQLQTVPKMTVQERLKVAQQPQLQQPTQPRVVPSPVDDPRLRLNSYAEARNLPFPVYKDVPLKKGHSIFSSVTVGLKKYSSYPHEAKTKEESEKIAAQVALDDLLGEDKRPSTVTEDRNVIQRRIVQIVNEHPNGIFESSLVETYFAKYNEGLPQKWLKIVEPVVTVDIAANNMPILSPPIDGNQSNSRPASPTTTVEIPSLRLEHLDQFWLQVYVAYSTDDVWGVIIDEEYSDKIDDLAKEMKDFYDVPNHTRPIVSKGKYYAVLDSEWHRVRCLEVDPKTETARVFFIDRGDEDDFSLSRLRDLALRFCNLPAQAVRVLMTGLEPFSESEKVQSLLEEMILENAVAVVRTKLDQGCVSAQLYFDDDNKVSINEILIKEVLDKIYNPSWYLETTKTAQEAYISCIRKKDVYVQLKIEGLEYLKQFTDVIAEMYLEDKQIKKKPVAMFEKNKRYLIKKPGYTDWCRVEIDNIKNSDQATAFCIDTGEVFDVRKSELVLIEDWSELLANYPAQAVKIQLHKISPIIFDEKMAAHLRELAPKTELFYMKTVGNEGIPIVEFYKRTENNLMASLNDTLVLEKEISPKEINNNARRRSDRSSLGARYEFPLKPPTLAPLNEYCDVHVTMAAHPGNFTVQPFSTRLELEKLMTDLCKACKDYNGPAVTSSNVKVGSMYAAKYEDDGKWYRAYISKILGNNMAAVYYCDYGDYRAVTLDQLQPLQNQFFDLPYQAIKAKLHGVQPVLKGDWTVKDSLRFNELIVAKDLVMLIRSYEPDNILSGETILSVQLYDTSDPQTDIDIVKILVDEKRAEKI